MNFPEFNLKRLLKTIFDPKKGEKVCILIDLDNPQDVINFSFLKEDHPVQKKAHDIFYQGLRNGLMQEFQLESCDFFAYKTTGGSNLELPAIAISPDGKTHTLDPEIFSNYDIILCITDFSATAPLTAAAKKFGFRGSTMHGMNDIILKSGLAVDYNDVSKFTEKLRLGMTEADWVEIDFEVNNKKYQMHIDLNHQEAQKSHGLCRVGPDVANLPAGEVYFVPTDAHGSFPIKFEEDGTIGLMEVKDGKVTKVSLISGDQKTVKKYQSKFSEDPSAAVIGELGFGTQVLPYSGADIQDEKIFGTFHIATGRNDHLNGTVNIKSFHNLQNATHDDILFSSTKTPEIEVKQVRMKRHNKLETLIENYQPSPYLLNLLKSDQLALK